MLIGLLLNMAALILFMRFPKRISLEITACWIITSVYVGEMYALSTLNLKWIETPHQVVPGLTNSLCHLLVIPVMTMLFLQLYVSRHNLASKIMLFTLTVVFLVCFDRLLEALGFFHYKDRNIIWDMGNWAVLCLVVIGTRNVFRHVLEREVSN